MEDLYAYAGISRQAYFQHWQREFRRSALESALLDKVDALRSLHPQMGCRKLYHKLRPEGIGRDKFELLLQENGYGVLQRRNKCKTTHSGRWYSYPNLLNGNSFRMPDEAWVTDITYLLLGEKHLYLVLIMDVYSRRLLGYSVADHMRSEANISALQMAFRERRGKELSGLVHHSDRGSQYVAENYLRILASKRIKVSMGAFALENAYAERINGTIKNEYIYPYGLRGLEEVKRAMRRIKKLYNEDRPHNSLDGRSPADFEANWARLEPKQRPQLKVKEVW